MVACSMHVWLTNMSVCIVLQLVVIIGNAELAMGTDRSRDLLSTRTKLYGLTTYIRFTGCSYTSPREISK